MNEEIRIPNVLLISDTGQKVGIIPTRTAMAMAVERGLDLVEVAPDANPPVCKILDYGKVKYERKRQQHGPKHQPTIKELRLRIKIERHDLETKLKNARKFLEKGDRVQFTLQLRGREQAYPERANEVLAKVLEELADMGKVDAMPKNLGRRITMIVAPLPSLKTKKGTTDAKKQDA